jgi:hypothetical protein
VDALWMLVVVALVALTFGLIAACDRTRGPS